MVFDQAGDLRGIGGRDGGTNHYGMVASLAETCFSDLARGRSDAISQEPLSGVAKLTR